MCESELFVKSKQAGMPAKTVNKAIDEDKVKIAFNLEDFLKCVI